MNWRSCLIGEICAPGLYEKLFSLNLHECSSLLFREYYRVMKRASADGICLDNLAIFKQWLLMRH